MVYFVQGNFTRRIKIGSSGPNWKERFADLSETITCLRTIDGGHAVANQWRKCHRASQAHGDWFQPTPELLRAITQLDPTIHTGVEYTPGQVPARKKKTGKTLGRHYAAKQYDCIDCGVGKTRNKGRRCMPCYVRARDLTI